MISQTFIQNQNHLIGLTLHALRWKFRGGSMNNSALRIFAIMLSLTASAWTQTKPAGCEKVPEYSKLKAALQAAVKEGKAANSGLGNQEWAVVVNRDGVVCTVVFSGPDRGSQWPGSRLIAAEKANTSNALSVDNFALSTANLYFASTPGQSLFSLTTSAPPNPQAVFGGDPNKQGQPDDPMVGKPIGGIIVFGGGLALYDPTGHIVGGLGVSGDTSCADHVVAWKIRHQLNFDAVPNGVAAGPGPNDNMILDIQNGNSPSGFGHPSCKGGQPPDEIIKELPQKYPTGPK
jgi:uncharacterized protein GlcG (DUF336 family)